MTFHTDQSKTPTAYGSTTVIQLWWTHPYMTYVTHCVSYWDADELIVSFYIRWKHTTIDRILIYINHPKTWFANLSQINNHLFYNKQKRRRLDRFNGTQICVWHHLIFFTLTSLRSKNWMRLPIVRFDVFPEIFRTLFNMNHIIYLIYLSKLYNIIMNNESLHDMVNRITSLTSFPFRFFYFSASRIVFSLTQVSYSLQKDSPHLFSNRLSSPCYRFSSCLPWLAFHETHKKL